MMRRCGLLITTLLIVSCGNQGQPAAPPTPGPAAAQKPYANLAQMMRGIPFPSSNIIFDTQTVDPGAAQKPSEVGKGATASFASVYSWLASR